ncbi:protein S-acyltransferase [Malassezia obtusa]|uniref:Palmitoyltransferase n=1 Tax=Malassezia obtusa TaxID=76774 RepID=A0AAF0E284_9BASI|nr:protein S-acyltransferase [Malassezia obtusa]
MSWLGGVSAAVLLTLLGYAAGALVVDVIVPVWDAPQVYLRAGIAVFLPGMTAWSYFVAGLRSSVRRDELEADSFRTVKRSTGTRRWCSKCLAPKPDRCHHCRKCKRCILRMDHHCPWILDTCIGLRNYHAFVLLLGYASLFCAYTLYTLVVAFMRLLDEPTDDIALPISWIVLAAIALVVRRALTQFGLALLPFSLFHVYLTSVNSTTLEYIEGMERVRQDDQNQNAPPTSQQRLTTLLTQGDDSREQLLPEQNAPRARSAQREAKRYKLYNVGVCANWRQVLGPRPWLWWTPIETPVCDGVHYEVNPTSWAHLQSALQRRAD